ncbi:tetratricopeptide repeat protein [Planomonospora sp. ID91781]|uniref:tetratricopeptide repeat protein n=1 Tax=Planomonospora sp. ID91781 TaxID=2738135 RepID=UPI0018C42E53|nr:tetratricopeptide repeat protein [Planomonospora sp. ID91781]MBG0819644.1 tetratricopeptide repeat protein [Planomonospora sp. ID91781]
MTLGELLLAYRRRAGVTQRELAGRAGVGVRTLRDIEQGAVRRPHARSVRRLIEAAGLSAAELDLLQEAPGPGPLREAPGPGPIQEAAESLPPHPGDPVLRIELLGPLTVRVLGRAADLRPPMQRRLLGLLALQADRVVTHTEIVDFLWGEEIPATYPDLVHTHVSRLRRFLGGAGAGEELISRTGAGYRLALASGQSDLLDFTDLVARAAAHRDAGETEDAERAYEEALSLWRGQPLADLAPHALHHPVAVAVSQQRLAAALDHADLALGHGHHQAALERLREVLPAEPLHEGLNARIVLALAASGQRAAALRAFGDLRDRLRDDLGIEPGPELRDAHTRALGQEAAAQASAPPPSGLRPDAVPAELPADIATFTGRERQISRLNDHLTAADARPAAAGLSVISGTAGVGKTSLAVHWSHRVRHRFPDGQLFYNLHGYSDSAAKTAADALSGFLTALGVPPANVPLDVDARISLFRTMTADRRLLLVLDNVTGPDQVRPLLPANRHSAVVVTSRNDLSGLKVHGDALIVELDVLDDGEAVALLTRLLGAGTHDASPELLGELARLCARLPLALRIAAANISRGAYGTVQEYLTALRAGDRIAELAIDDTRSTAVEAAFALSYAALPPRAARLFRLISLVPGVDFTLDAAAALSGSGAAETRRELTRLATAHLVDRYEPGRYRFHDLLRLYAAERAAEEEHPDDAAKARQRLYDWYLLSVRAAVEQGHPHWVKLPPGATSEGVTPASFADPASAARWLAAEHRNLVAAVHHAARSGPRRAAWLLTDAMRSHFWASGSMSDWLSCAQAAVTAAEEEGDVPGMAAAMLTLANAHAFQGRHDALSLFTRASSLADRGGWTEGTAAIRNNIAGYYLRAGRLDDAARWLAEGIELDEEAGRSGMLGIKHINLAQVYAQMGRLDSALSHLDRGFELHPDTDGMTALNLGEVCYLQGRFDDALRHLGRALSLSEKAGSHAVELHSLAYLAEVHCDLGRYEAALAHGERALLRSRDIADPYFEAIAHNALGRLAHSTGRHVQAAEHYRRAVELADETHVFEKTAALVGLANATRGLDAAEAVSFAEQALRLARERSFRLMEGLARTALADIALAAGDRPEAVRQARTALEIHRQTGHRLGEARVLRTLGEAASGADAGSYRNRSVRLFHEIGSAEAARPPGAGP